MRIETLNKLSSQTRAVDLPPKLNPVRIGNDARSHVVLESPHVGAETGVFDNDAAGGGGWQFWNRSGKPIRVNGVLLTARDQHIPITRPRVTLEVENFVLTAIFTPDELDAGRADTDRLERLAAEFVRNVHRRLVELHPNDVADRAEWLRDSYVHELEGQTADLASDRPEFPGDDTTQTELGTHLAGVALRNAVIQNLVAKSPDTDKEVAVRPERPWVRYRAEDRDLEAELFRRARQVEVQLGLDDYADLTDQVAAVDRQFWSAVWPKAADVLGPQKLRYFALRRLVKEVKDVWYGFGPLEDLLDDPSVTEIMVVSADDIFIEKNGEIERPGGGFLTDPVTIIQRVMAAANRQINAAQPMADARMPDGDRVNAIISPLALSGPCLTIRRFPVKRPTMKTLVEKYQSLSQAAADFLQAAVINRRNIIVSGGTGTGKTTVLNCLSEYIPDKERIVTVEDTAELRLHKSHVVTLQARPRNTEGAGEVTIRQLVRNTLRMRPDRIVVGECRGGEAVDMLTAMNTGHDGSLTTIHANNPADVVLRLETIAQDNPDIRLPVESIRRQIVSAVDVIVQLGWVGGRRVVTEIAEVRGYDAEDGEVRIVDLFKRRANGRLEPTGSLPTFMPALIAAGLVPNPVAFVLGDRARKA